MRGAWKEVADENRNLNRQQHALSEEAGRLKERCDTLKQAIGKVDLDLAEANVEAKKLSAEIVEVRSLASVTTTYTSGISGTAFAGTGKVGKQDNG